MHDDSGVSDIGWRWHGYDDIGAAVGDGLGLIVIQLTQS